MKPMCLATLPVLALLLTGTALAEPPGGGHGMGRGPMAGAGPCAGDAAAAGMRGADHMGQGMMGQGMMGQGMMGQGMMGQGMKGQGMGPGMMGQGMPGRDDMMPGRTMGAGRPGMAPTADAGPGADLLEPHYGRRVVPPLHLSADDVRRYFALRLRRHGNDRLQLGKVEAADDDTVAVEIVTSDGSLVRRFDIERSTGLIEPAG